MSYLFFQTPLCKIWAVRLKLLFSADHLGCPLYSYLYLWKRRLDQRIPLTLVRETLGHCKTSNFFMPVFTTQITWEPQRIMVRQWILHYTSFLTKLDDDKHRVAEFSAPFFLQLQRCAYTLFSFSENLLLLKAKSVLFWWVECWIFLTHYKIKINLIFWILPV